MDSSGQQCPDLLVQLSYRENCSLILAAAAAAAAAAAPAPAATSTSNDYRATTLVALLAFKVSPHREKLVTNTELGWVAAEAAACWE